LPIKLRLCFRYFGRLGTFDLRFPNRDVLNVALDDAAARAGTMESGEIDAPRAGETARERRSKDTVSVMARRAGHGRLS
jgi:hypothetical protein